MNSSIFIEINITQISFEMQAFFVDKKIKKSYLDKVQRKVFL